MGKSILYPAIITDSLYPRRLILFEPVFFLIAGVGLIYLTGPFLSDIKHQKSFKGLMCVVALIVFSIGIGIYQRKVAEFPKEQVQQEAEYIAHAIEKDVVIVLKDIYSLENRVRFLSWNNLRSEEVPKRFFIAQSIKDFEHLSPLDVSAEGVQFILDLPEHYLQINKILVEERLKELKIKEPSCELIYDHKKKQQERVVLYCPLRAFDLARDFAYSMQ